MACGTADRVHGDRARPAIVTPAATGGHGYAAPGRQEGIVAATRLSKRMELVVQLERWDAAREYDRLGLDENAWELFGVKIPLVHMPVAPGRNLAILVEVAARNQLLRARGLNAARELASRLDAQLREADGDASAEEDVEHGGPA